MHSEIDKNEEYLTHKIEFMESENSLTPYIGYTFNVVLTDTLLMFHICHLYHNCLQLLDDDKITESEIDDYITFEYILLSIQEALDNRIKCLSASYIDDNYKWCYERPEVFDKCLEYFGKLKKELQEKIQEKINNQKENDITSKTLNKNKISD